jgi:uncharacterized repeat protein (TIGR01451 family)
MQIRLKSLKNILSELWNNIKLYYFFLKLNPIMKTKNNLLSAVILLMSVFAIALTGCTEEDSNKALEADLSVTITTSSANAYVGHDLNYTITVKNNGPKDALNVKAIATLPGTVSFVGADNDGSPSGGKVNWNLSTLASGKTSNLSVVLNVNNGISEGTEIKITVAVSSDTNDPKSDNNTASSEINVSVPPDDGPISGTVTGIINENEYVESQSNGSVFFNRIPHTLDKFIELQNQIAHTPQGAVAMMLIAMRIYQQYPIEGMKCMTAACTGSLIVPSSAAGSYGGYIMSNVSTLKERLKIYPYLPFIYYQGAEPENGYTPDAPPYKANMYTNLYSYSQSSGGMWIKLFVETKGADSNRPVSVRKAGNIYKVVEYSSLYLGPKPPK